MTPLVFVPSSSLMNYASVREAAREREREGEGGDAGDTDALSCHMNNFKDIYIILGMMEKRTPHKMPAAETQMNYN